MIHVIDSCDRFRFFDDHHTDECYDDSGDLITVSHQRRMWRFVAAIVGPRRKVGGDAVQNVLLFFKEQAVNNILAIDVDGSHRSVRFGSREGMCAASDFVPVTF